jgi:hypothetical protein
MTTPTQANDAGAAAALYARRYHDARAENLRLRAANAALTEALTKIAHMQPGRAVLNLNAIVGDPDAAAYPYQLVARAALASVEVPK